MEDYLEKTVVLATMLVRPINLLILDEPTNHLDIQSRETLLAALQNFSGTVVLVSAEGRNESMNSV